MTIKAVNPPSEHSMLKTSALLVISSVVEMHKSRYKAAINLERNKDRHHTGEPETNVSLSE